ncbi:MAG TPA: hypothetical protein VK105_00370 [Virgibacillus sp.]|nr:hypothetical protein [Virgibacillus sp.]HLR65577.1 hypothetical protein [Virgibacillus sp.]
MSRKKIYVYNITLSNGELLKNIEMKGSLEWNLSGVAVNLAAVKDENGNSVVLNKYHIIKAELITIKK